MAATTDFVLRAGDPADADGITDVQVASWRAGYAHVFPESVLYADDFDSSRRTFWTNWRFGPGHRVVGRDGAIRRRRRARDRVLLVRARARAGPRVHRSRRGVGVHTNLGRAPLPEAALERVAEVGAGYSNLEYDLGDGERGRARTTRAAPLAADGRRGGARRQQQRRRRPARARGSGRGPRGDRLARRADRDRGRLSDSGRARALGREARRGRDDEPDARRGLRARDRAGDGADPARPPVELPRRRVLGAASARGARRDRARATSSRSSTISARERSRRSATSRRRPRASARAPTSSRSRATSCSAGRRRGSSSGARARRAAPAASSPARAARRQAHPRRARGHARAALDPALGEIPVLRMLHEPVERVRERAERLAAAVGGEVEETVARVGGGALPLAEVASAACAVEEELALPLRIGEPPVIGIVRDGQTVARLPHAHRRRSRRGRRGGGRCTRHGA